MNTTMPQTAIDRDTQMSSALAELDEMLDRASSSAAVVAVRSSAPGQSHGLVARVR